MGDLQSFGRSRRYDVIRFTSLQPGANRVTLEELRYVGIAAGDRAQFLYLIHRSLIVC